MEKKLSPYHYRARLKAVISVVNHVMPERSPPWCKRKLLGEPELVYLLVSTANSWSSATNARSGSMASAWG